MRSRYGWRVVCGVIAAWAVWGGCGQAPPPPAPLAVKVKELRAEAVTSATRFSATVQPRQTVELAFKVPGTVARLLRVRTDHGERDVQEGDVLNKNETIAELDPQDYIRQRDRASAELAAAAEQVRRAAAAREFAVRELRRLDDLRASESVSQKELDDGQSRFDIADAEYVASLRAREAAQLVYDQAVANVADCTLRVPIDNATVVQKRVEPQERVERHQPVFRIMDVSTIHVEFGVPDTLLGLAEAGRDGERLSLGRELRIYLDAFEGRTFSGRVTKIAPAADPNTRTFSVEVTLDNADSLIKPGMIATVSVGEERTAVLLPMTAIQRGAQPGAMAVYVIDVRPGEAVAERRQVTLGGVYNNQIEVKLDQSDVRVGERVAVTGAWRLQPGAVVRVLPREPGERTP